MPVDMRREDLAVPYVHEPQAKPAAMSTMGTTLPIAAMFMRSKVLAWGALFTSTQTYLNEPEYTNEQDKTPGWVPLITASLGVGVTYLDFVMGRPGPKVAAANTVVETAANIIEATVA